VTLTLGNNAKTSPASQGGEPLDSRQKHAGMTKPEADKKDEN
jgi:hypothetical protein